MTDYSVRMRCQCSKSDGTHCTRRGRQRFGFGLFFCLQHYYVWERVLHVGSAVLVYPAEELLG